VLPAPHAVAIRLRDGGLSDHVIAVALEIDEDQVPTLLQIAESKLSNAMALDLTATPRTDCADRPRATPASRSRDKGVST
jgi:hypothetical protein